MPSHDDQSPYANQGASPTGGEGGPRFCRHKVRAEAQKLDGAGLRVWLDRAIDRLPDDAFPELIAEYANLRDILADGTPPPNLLQSIYAFYHQSMAGRYYQTFDVTGGNCLQFSQGTELFVAEHSRLVEACLRAELAGDHETVAEALGLLIELMRQLDQWERDIVFFADEPGSWQVCVLWDRVLPAWFRSLSPTTKPAVWAKIVIDALNVFAGYQMDAILAAARDAGTNEQRAALEAADGDLRRRR